jgi:hypothetical protein
MTTYDDITYTEEQRERNYETHPRGETLAVCVDVIDLGMQENTFKKGEHGEPLMERRIRIVWETGRVRTNGKRFTISKSYKLSLYDGANGGNSASLWKHLSSWLGKTWDGKFRSADLVGRAALLFVENEKSKSDKTKTIAKILAVNPVEDGQTFTASGSYKRFVPKDDTPF